MIEVLIADDHKLLIDGIKTTLKNVSDIKIVAKAYNGLQVLKILKEQKVDVILMDINMPQMDGLDCCKIVSKEYPDVKIIALSQFDEKRFVKRMIKNGASGYVLKDTSKNELIKAIKKVYLGETYFSDRLSINILQREVNQSPFDPLFPKLTRREMEVLRLISFEYNSLEIADRLHVRFHTVETHRVNLISKAGAKNSAGLVRWAMENGLLD